MFGDDASSPLADTVAEVNVPAESDSNIDNVRSLLTVCPVLKVAQSLPYYLLEC